MFNPEKFVSLLYVAYTSKDKTTEIVLQAIDKPDKVQAADYYLVFQAPVAEMFSKTPETLAVELGEYTLSPEWKSTGRRVMCTGDIVAIGCDAYVTITEREVTDELKSQFKPMTGVTVKDEIGECQVGIIKLGNSETLKDIICRSCKKV